MGYLHIENLYKNQDILLFKECWALEKVHGTSAHVSWNGEKVSFFSGGEKYDNFVALFDAEKLKEKFLLSVGLQKAVVYGEAYGGKCQGMSHTYGKELKFICFDVKIEEQWLAVPNMVDFCTGLELEVVPYRKVPTTLEALNAERDLPSEVAVRRGFDTDKIREGVILRPLIEFIKNNGSRVIAKHKAEAFSERATPQKIIDPTKLKVLENAKEVADEWVTEMRMTHVLDKMPAPIGVENTKEVISAMIEDVRREAVGEIVESKEVMRAISARTAAMFKDRLKQVLKDA